LRPGQVTMTLAETIFSTDIPFGEAVFMHKGAAL
jgi:hypothetical protein